MRSVWRHGAFALAAGMLLLTAAACGGDDGDKGATSGATSSAPAGALTLVARDNKYDKTELTVKAGAETTLVFENKGSAIHNFKATNVKSADGKEIGTQLLAGGKSETITFTIEQAGAYNYQCDTHPAEMRGKITAQ